jgi:archaellum biogenesis ATPase FlaH
MLSKPTPRLYVLDPEVYNEEALKIIKDRSKNPKEICYISLNKTYKSLQESFSKQKIDPDKFSFIDAVTTNLFAVSSTDKVVVVDAFESNFTFFSGLISAIKMFIESQKPELVIIDSLSSLMLRRDEEQVQMFLDSMLDILEENKIPVIAFTLKEDIHKGPVKQFEMRED